MAGLDPQGIGLIRDDGGEIGADDLELVVVETDGVGGLGGADHHVSRETWHSSNATFLPVDDAEEMLLSRLDSPLRTLTLGAIRRLVLTVEQVVGGRWQRPAHSSDIVSDLEDGLIESLVNHHGAHVKIVILGCRTVNDDGASNTTAILSHGVRVIPAGSVR